MSEKKYKTFDNDGDVKEYGGRSWLSRTCYRWWWVLHTCLNACLDTWCSCCDTEVVRARANMLLSEEDTEI